MRFFKISDIYFWPFIARVEITTSDIKTKPGDLDIDELLMTVEPEKKRAESIERGNAVMQSEISVAPTSAFSLTHAP